MEIAKKYVRKIKVLKNIKDIAMAGEIFNYSDIAHMHPYLDLSNKEYFEETFDSKFKVNDQVYVIDDYGVRSITHTACYVVAKVINKVRGEYLYTTYEIYDKEKEKQYKCNGLETINISEKYLRHNNNKYIVSLSSDTLTNPKRPAIHTIPERKVQNTVVGTWKEQFVFNTYEDAVNFADNLVRFIEQYTLYNTGKCEHELDS